MDPSKQKPSASGLPPPPLKIPAGVVPQHVASFSSQTDQSNKALVPKRSPIARHGLGTKGRRIDLLTNHFKVTIGDLDSNVSSHFYQYNVNMVYEDGTPVNGKDVGRKVIDKVYNTYYHMLNGVYLAYDGEKSLFTHGSLRSNKYDFTVVLDDAKSSRGGTVRSSEVNEVLDESDRKRLKRPFHSKQIKVEIGFASTIPIQAIASTLRGQETEKFQDAVRVLDIVLRQHAAKQGCLLVRQSYFQDNPRNFVGLGGGILGCRGFHSSFRRTQSGLSLNMDVSTTMIVQPGPVISFLMNNQNVGDPYHIDWIRAKRMLKNLKIRATHTNVEYKITGLSGRPCREETFILRQRSTGVEVEITVYDYFKNHHHMSLRKSADFPCINVGKTNKPSYLPIELCELVSLQRYTKALSSQQRASLVERSRQKPQERMSVLSKALEANRYETDPLLHSAGISISPEFMQVKGRVLPAPKLIAGNEDEIFPQTGRWNFNQKKLVQPVTIDHWAIVNFSFRCDIEVLLNMLRKCSQMKGINLYRPIEIFQEKPENRRASASVRVEKMIEDMRSQIRDKPKFLLCLLPERKNCDIYGQWKRRVFAEMGIVTQCAVPIKLNDQYVTNLLLKINAKFGGLNSMLTIERSKSIPVLSKHPTMILGMDVSHGAPGRSETPSIAAVVSSRCWPSISLYRAVVCTQPPKTEMIENLFNPDPDTNKDNGIFRDLLEDFYKTSGGNKPQHVIIFRDGVSESQFNQVLNIELEQIIEACKLMDEIWVPKFTVIIAQKRHHTKFFVAGSQANVPAGTIVDSQICHPSNNDFYLCAHNGPIGTTRPTHYQVLYDEANFSADELQELVHNLSYVYQRSTTAVSLVAPVSYAHLAAAQMGQCIKFEEFSETGEVPKLPELHGNVKNTMFFC